MKQGISDQISPTLSGKKRKRREKTLDISDRQFIEGDDGFYRYTMPTVPDKKAKSKLIYFLNARAKDFGIDGPIKFEHDKKNKEQIIIIPKQAGQIWNYLMDERKRQLYQGTSKRLKIASNERKFIEKDGMFYHYPTGTQSLSGIKGSIQSFARNNLKITNLDIKVDSTQKAICMTKESYARWTEAINKHSYQSSKTFIPTQDSDTSAPEFNFMSTNPEHETVSYHSENSPAEDLNPLYGHQSLTRREPPAQLDSMLTDLYSFSSTSSQNNFLSELTAQDWKFHPLYSIEIDEEDRHDEYDKDDTKEKVEPKISQDVTSPLSQLSVYEPAMEQLELFSSSEQTDSRNIIEGYSNEIGKGKEKDIEEEEEEEVTSDKQSYDLESLQEKISEQWKDFTLSLQTFFEELTPSKLARVQARYNLANQSSILTPPTISKTLLVSDQEKKSKYKRYPSKAVKYPHVCAESAKKDFRKTVLPGELALAQYGSFVGVPFTASPVDGFTIARSPEYQSRESRANYLRQYYLPFHGQHDKKLAKFAAKALIILFSHIVKEQLITLANVTSVKTLINYELGKLGFPELNKEILVQLSLLIPALPHQRMITSQYHFDDSPKNPVRMPAVGQTQIEAKDNQGIAVYWLKKTKHIQKGMKIDDPGTALIIDHDADVYDIDTGVLIGSLRKQIIDQKSVDEINKYAFNTTLNTLQQTGARTFYDKKEKGTKNQNRVTPRSAAIGILGLQTQDIKVSSFIESHDHNVELINAIDNIIEPSERMYQQIAPAEFDYCVEASKPLSEFFIFPKSKITTVTQLNFDKQTYTHTDFNHFPGKTYGFLTCFYGSTEKRYEGGFTLFPEYDVAFNLEQRDIFVGNFRLYHCNTDIHLKDQRETLKYEKFEIPNWHRVSLVGFSRGELARERMAFENSDDETDFDEDLIQKELRQPSTHSRQYKPSMFSHYMQKAHQANHFQRSDTKYNEKAEAFIQLRNQMPRTF